MSILHFLMAVSLYIRSDKYETLAHKFIVFDIEAAETAAVRILYTLADIDEL
jgi:hypothetical protein